MFSYAELEKWGLASYFYLCLAGIFALALMVVWFSRPDLRRVIITVGPWGSAVEVYTDLRYYLHDYWRPPTLLPGHLPIVEDLIFGFSVTALAACAVAFLAPPPPWRRGQRGYVRGYPQDRGWLGLAMAVIGYLAGMELLVRFAHLNSIWAAALCFGIIGLVGVALWPELWWVGLTAGVVMAALDFTGYYIGLNLVVGGGDVFLRQVLLYHGSGAARVPGTNVLANLLVWSFCRGWCVAVLYPLFMGRRLLRLPRNNPYAAPA